MQKPDHQPKWISIGDASKYLGISRDTLRRWEKRGVLKPLRSPTNHRYYTIKQLDEALGNRSTHKVVSLSQPQRKQWKKLLVIAGLSLCVTALLAFLIQHFFLKY